MWIDDVQVGKVLRGQEAVIPVSPGAHHVQLRWAPLWASLGAKNSETLFFQVEPGQTIDFDCTNDRSGGRIILRGPAGPPAPVPHGSGAGDARVLQVTETTRIEEWLGEDVRLIDNRSSPAPVTRSLKASREWTRTLTVGENNSQTLGGDVGVNLLWLSAKGSIEAELQRSLSLAIGSNHLFEEEISVTVPERTAVRIQLGWKRIWQCGNAHTLLPDNSMHIVPYRVVVSVTFDQKILDVTSLPDG